MNFYHGIGFRERVKEGGKGDDDDKDDNNDDDDDDDSDDDDDVSDAVKRIRRIGARPFSKENILR